VITALKMLRKVRQGKNIEDALHILHSMPQYLREPGRDINGVEILGEIEYITELEIRHGSEVLGWLRHHISLLLVKYLVSIGADVNAKGDAFWYIGSIIHHAAVPGLLDVIEYLVSSQHVDVDLRDDKGQTALHWAAIFFKLPVAEYLILQGADVNARCNENKTALHHSAYYGFREMEELLVTHKADVNIQDNEGYTPLHHAANRGQLETVKFLITHAADVNITDNAGRTPLHLAADLGRLEIIKYLLTLAPDVHVRDNDGETILHHAAYWGDLATVQWLVTEAAANTSVTDSEGNTALDLARKSRYYYAPTVVMWLQNYI
jgi:ankyrin repeat protein